VKKRVIAVFLISVAGILTYLCACLAGFLSIDDVGMIDGLRGQTHTVKSLFFAGANEYYRPLVTVSFVINAFFGGLGPGPFHAVNVALHLANAMLVFWFAIELMPGREDREWVALLAALFFLLSPLNSEAVCWISARPDLLCTFFFLLAAILMVKRGTDASPGTLCLIAVAYLASLCSKEASIVLFGIAPVYLLARAGKGERRFALLMMLTVFAATACYAFLRTGPRAAVDQGIGTVVQGVVTRGPAHPTLLDGVGAYGFYLKKLVLPLPLNFTILGYQKSSAFIALLAALPIGYLLLRRHREALLPLLIVFLGIAPAVLAYLGHIAWTPLGERYLYLPMTGFSFLVALLLSDLKRVPRVVPVACLLLMSLLTMGRVALWCDPFPFWSDALRFSPDFAKAHSALGVLAIEDHRWDDAEREIRKAIALGQNQPLVWQNLAKVYAARHDYHNYETAMVKAASLSPHPTAIYSDLIQTLLGEKVTDRKALYAKAIKYHLLAVQKDPSLLDAYYNIGKLYLAEGDLTNAQRYLTLYAERAKNGQFRPFALKMIRRISMSNPV